MQEFTARLKRSLHLTQYDTVFQDKSLPLCSGEYEAGLLDLVTLTGSNHPVLVWECREYPNALPWVPRHKGKRGGRRIDYTELAIKMDDSSVDISLVEDILELVVVWHSFS